MIIPTIERVITLEVAHNVRHVGGYRAGERTTSARIIRAASLHRLTNDSIDALRSLGVKAVVDFRSQRELEQTPTPAALSESIAVTHAPVFTSDASPAGFDTEFPGFGPVYQRFLDEGKPAYRALAETILRTDGSVLFHCAAGKDRTGVAAALLLELAGVDDDAIVSDYAETERHLAPEIPTWIEKMGERDIPAERAEKLLRSDPVAMKQTLANLRSGWGGAAGYFEATGLSVPQIDLLRERVLDS